ncbi:hypothetical protein M8818_003994 [Zalaria obscura]|uniref:Uncharacterized protein n=1 Tax=Zalaria obscura TaxID=2024903 RepID=A0ACC3SDY0_9PEZI
MECHGVPGDQTRRAGRWLERGGAYETRWRPGRSSFEVNLHASPAPPRSIADAGRTLPTVGSSCSIVDLRTGQCSRLLHATRAFLPHLNAFGASSTINDM